MVLAAIPSPDRGVWYLGPVPIRAYALCIIAGIVIAVLWGERRFVARGGEAGVVTDVAVYAVPFGLVGGRLYHVITDWQTYFGPGGDPIDALKIWQGGLGIWGAVALGGVGAWIGCRRRGVPLPFFADAVAPGIVTAQAVGRLGNWFNQELYGAPTTLPWGLEIYRRVNPDTGAPDGLTGVVLDHTPIETVHPTFLYELLWNLLVAALVVWADRRFRLGHGRAFAVYVAGYTAGRFWIEQMRTDYATRVFGDLRINVVVAAVVFVCAVLYLVVVRKPREVMAPVGPDGLESDRDETLSVGAGAAAAAASATTVSSAAGETGATVALKPADSPAAGGARDAEPDPTPDPESPVGAGGSDDPESVDDESPVEADGADRAATQPAAPEAAPAAPDAATSDAATSDAATSDAATSDAATSDAATSDGLGASRRPASGPSVSEPAADLSRSGSASDEAASDEAASDVAASDEQPAAEAASGQPASDETASDELASAEPAYVESASDQSGSVESASDQAASNEPASNEPASNEPASNEPASNEPASNEPASNEPAPDDAASDQPASDQRSASDDTSGPTSAGNGVAPADRAATADAPHTNENGRDRVVAEPAEGGS